ncbi:hypothetical protein OIU76_026640 [Salix suchowensis]|nr:hypothetical protein OIU76_026640 [Salix suchowensis]
MKELFLYHYWLIKLLAISFLAFVFLIKIVVLLWCTPRRIEHHFSKQGIRGPPYRFFIGNVKEIVEMMLKASSQPMPFSHNILPRVLSFYHHWKKIYGATFLVWFGPTVRLTVSDPDLIREIFTSKSELYEKLLVPVVAKSAIDMVEKWSAMTNSDEVEIDVCEWFQTLTEDVITRTVFGSSYEDGKAIFQLQAQQMVLAAVAFRRVLIPGYRFLPTKRNINSWRLDKEIKKSLMKLIERRKEKSSINRTHQDGCPKDLLGLMIQASNSSTDVTIHDIVEECKSFFFAGQHTTSNLLTWTTVLLAMHPQWQAQAREEVLRVCGSRDVPTKDDVAKLKTLTMILNESLRLYPPTIATIRRSRADVELGGYKVPGGTEILIPILALHHDPVHMGQRRE